MTTNNEIGIAIMIVIFAFFFVMGLGDNEPKWKQCKICRVYYMSFEEGLNGECPYVHSKAVISRYESFHNNWHARGGS